MSKSSIFLAFVLLILPGIVFSSNRNNNSNHNSDGVCLKDSSIIITNQAIHRNIKRNYNFTRKLICEPLVTLSSPIGFYLGGLAALGSMKNSNQPRKFFITGAIGGSALPLAVAYLFNQIRRIIARSRIKIKYKDYRIDDRSSIFIPVSENYKNFSLNLGINYFNLITTNNNGRPGFMFGLENNWLAYKRFSLKGRSLLINQERTVLKNRIIKKVNKKETHFTKSNLYIFNNSLELGVSLNYNIVDQKKNKIQTGIGYGWKLTFPYHSKEKIIEREIYKNTDKSLNNYEYDYKSSGWDIFFPFSGNRYVNIKIGYIRDNLNLNFLYQKNITESEFPVPTNKKNGVNQIISVVERGHSFKIITGASL